MLPARFGRDLFEEVLNRTARREKRTRRLPAPVMIRYVIAMGLFFDESYDEVMRWLVGNLHIGASSTRDGPPICRPARSATFRWTRRSTPIWRTGRRS